MSTVSLRISFVLLFFFGLCHISHDFIHNTCKVHAGAWAPSGGLGVKESEATPTALWPGACHATSLCLSFFVKWGYDLIG